MRPVVCALLANTLFVALLVALLVGNVLVGNVLGGCVSERRVLAQAPESIGGDDALALSRQPRAVQEAHEVIRAAVQDDLPVDLRLSRRFDAIRAARQGLAEVRTPEFSATVSRRELATLLGRSLTAELSHTPLAALESLEVIEVSPSAQSVTVRAHFTMRLPQSPSVLMRGYVDGMASLAIAGPTISVYPLFDRIELEPLELEPLELEDDDSQGKSGPSLRDQLRADLIRSATDMLRGFIENLNQVSVQRPTVIRFDVQALDAARLAGLFRALPNVRVSSSERVLSFAVPVGHAALFIDDAGVHVLAELHHPAPDDAGLAEGMVHAGGSGVGLDLRSDIGPGNAIDDVDAEAVDQAFAALTRDFRRLREQTFGAALPWTSTHMLLTKESLARVLQSALAKPGICLEYTDERPRTASFSKDLRAYKKSDIQCTRASRSCACPSCTGMSSAKRSACHALRATCRTACVAETQARRSACKAAKLGVETLNGAMRVGTLSGDVEVMGSAKMCVRELVFADDLSGVTVRSDSKADADVAIRVNMDTQGIGHMVCVLPFSKTFRARAELAQELVVRGSIEPVATSDGSLELHATLAADALTVHMKPSPWEQLLDDPRLAVNCAFAAIALPTLSLSAALLDRRAPQGLDGLTDGRFQIQVPHQELRLRVRPLHIHVGSEQLALHPVFTDKHVGFTIDQVAAPPDFSHRRRYQDRK